MREMKDSGIEWIGKIPKHWRIVPVKYFISITNGSDPLTQSGDTCVYGSGSKSFKTCEEYKQGPAVLLGRKGTLDIPQWIDDKYWNIDTAFDAKPKNEDINLKLYYYLSVCFDYKKYSTQTALPSMTQSNYNNMKISLPPIEEQQRIASFLDEKCGHIDRMKNDIKKQIELLEEYKKSLITETVTKGLNPDAKMKDSGIEWIGIIPKHWKISKVKYFYDIALGKMLQPKQSSSADTYENYLCAINVCKNHLNFNTIKKMWFSEHEKKQYELKKGDLLVVEGGDVASSAIIEKNTDKLYFQNALHRVRSKENFDIRILRYWLIYVKCSSYIDLMCNKATIAHFSKEKFQQLPFVVIPINEQQRIADYLDEKCKHINGIISKKKQQLENINEYKKSLIYEYVTGKQEVK